MELRLTGLSDAGVAGSAMLERIQGVRDAVEAAQYERLRKDRVRLAEAAATSVAHVARTLPRHMLAFTFADAAANTFSAVEMEPLPAFSIATPIGTRVRIMNSPKTSRGILLLYPHNIAIVPGGPDPPFGNDINLFLDHLVRHFTALLTHRNESNHLFPPDNAPPSPQHHNEVDNVNDFAMDENNDADDGRRKGGGRGTGRGAARGRGSRGNAKASRNNAAKPTRDTTASRRNRSSAASRGRNRLAPDLPLDPHDFPAPVALPPQPQPARILPLPTYPDDEFTFSEDEEAFRALAQLDPSSAPVPRAYNSDDAFNYLPDTAFDDLPVLMDRPPPPSRQPRAELVDLSGASPTPTPRASDLRTPPQHQRKGRKTDEFDFSSSPFAGSSHVPLAAVSRAGTASGDSLPVSGGTADEVVLLCQITKARGRSTVEALFQEITMSPPRRIVTALIEDGTDVVRCVVKETLYPGWNDLSKLARWKESAMQCEWKMVLEWEAAEPVIVDMTAL